MALPKQAPCFLGVIVLFLLVGRAHAFGAGNIAGISKVEGQNWRHGDLEDTLLQIVAARIMSGKKFDKLNVSRTCTQLLLLYTTLLASLVTRSFQLLL